MEHKTAMCTCGTGGQRCLGCTRKGVASRSREVGESSPLLSPGKSTSGVPWPGLGSPEQERHGPTGESLAKGHCKDDGILASVI